MKSIVQVPDGSVIDVKRLRIPVKIETKCPVCSGSISIDMESSYLSSPSVGEKQELWGYCSSCDQHVEIGTVSISVSLTIEAK